MSARLILARLLSRPLASSSKPLLDFQGESLLSAGEADGVFTMSLNAADLGAYRERFPANLGMADWEELDRRIIESWL